MTGRGRSIPTNQTNTSPSRVNLVFFYVSLFFFRKGIIIWFLSRGNPANFPYMTSSMYHFSLFHSKFSMFPPQIPMFHCVFNHIFLHRSFVVYQPPACVDRLNPSPWSSQVGCQVGGPELKILKHQKHQNHGGGWKIIFPFLVYTPENERISPKKGPISIRDTSSNHPFSGDMLVFRGVNGWFVGSVFPGCTFRLLDEKSHGTVTFLPSQFPCHLEEPRTCFSG